MLNRNLTNKFRFGAFFIPYGRLQPLKIDPSKRGGLKDVSAQFGHDEHDGEF
jgi:hypothetical protein